MSRTRKVSAADKINRGLLEAIEIAKGAADPSTYRVHQVVVPQTIDVPAIRKAQKMSQAQFAAAFGIPLPTLRQWEQGVRQPEGPTRAYLKVIEREPDAVRKALQSA